MKDNKFKKTLNNQLLKSYIVLIGAELLMTLLYQVFYNHLLSEVYTSLESISFLQAYIIYYAARILFNRNKLGTELHEEIFDSFKRTLMKFIHYALWMAFIKLLLVFL